MKILTYNVGLLDLKVLGRSVIRPAPFVKTRFAALAASILALDADVVALQEIYRPDHKRELADQLASVYPHVAMSPLRGPSLIPASLMTLSKWPIRQSAFHRFKDMPLAERLLDNKGFLTATIDSPYGALQLTNVHTTAGGTIHPEDPRTDRLRSKQLKQLLDRIDRGTPSLMVGDFNCGSVSPTNYRELLAAGFKDAWQTLNPDQDGWTWEPSSSLNAGGTHSDWGCPAQRIDLILLSEAALRILRPLGAKVVFTEETIATSARRVTQSDHYGVLATLTPAG